MTTPIAVAYGDGVWPELMEAVLVVLREAGADIRLESVEIGKRIYDMGSTTGILHGARSALAAFPTLLASPVILPDGEQFQTPLEFLSERFEMIGICHMHDIAGHATLAYYGDEFSIFSCAHENHAKIQDALVSLLHAAILMLEYIGQLEPAQRIARAIQYILNNRLPKKANLQEMTELLMARLYL